MLSLSLWVGIINEMSSFIKMLSPKNDGYADFPIWGHFVCYFTIILASLIGAVVAGKSSRAI